MPQPHVAEAAIRARRPWLPAESAACPCWLRCFGATCRVDRALGSPPTRRTWRDEYVALHVRLCELDGNASGARLKEGANINKSLTTLGSVINGLVEQARGKKGVFIQRARRAERPSTRRGDAAAATRIVLQ